MPETDWNSVPIKDLEENLELMRNGMAVNLPQLYALPSKAAIVHENFVKRLKEGKWGFILVMGENRAGKSAYLKHTQSIALHQDYCIVNIELEEEEIKDYGANNYFSRAFFNKLRLPDGQLFSHKFSQDEKFRRRVGKVLEERRSDFEHYSSPLTSALLFAATSTDSKLQAIARAWLRGEPQYLADLRNIEIFDRKARSLLDVLTANIMYFMKELVSALEYSGLFVLIDEVERAGSLPAAKGKETLFILRNLINALVSDEAQLAKRGILNGIFLCFAISTYYLGFSQVIGTDQVQFKARSEREGRPKVLITDVPRLGNLLKQSATLVDVEVDEPDLERIAERILRCYERVEGAKISKTPKELVSEAFERTGGYLAGPNVQQMVKMLDSLRKRAN
jgi:bacteriophage exclusion system BrxC/D-like protein